MAVSADLKSKQALEGLVNAIKQANVPTPCSLGIKICKVTNQGMTRYMRCYVGNIEVSHLVATLVDYRISKSKDCYGAVIVGGCGMDMCFHLQNRVSQVASRLGMRDLFDSQRYRLIDGR